MAKIPETPGAFVAKAANRYGIEFTEEEKAYFVEWYKAYSFNAFIIECIRDGLVAPVVTTMEDGEFTFEFDIQNMPEPMFAYIMNKSE